MSNLALLMKNNLINESGINKLKYADKNDKIKAICMVLIIVFTVIMLSVYGFMACFYLSDFLVKINQMELLLILGIIGCTMATFFTSIYKASSYLFQSKDYEMLSSLPIKQSSILSSKIIMLVINNYLFAIPLLLIPGIVYFIKVDTGILYFPFLIILILTTPLIPTIISSIIAFIITNISSRSKKNNLLSIILNLSLVAIILLLSFNLQNIMMSLVQNSSSIIEATQKLYIPAYYFVDALKNDNIGSLLIFVLISIVPTVLFAYIFANNFNKINSKLSETYKTNNYKFKGLKSSKPVIALLNKEFKRYFSSTIYVMNTFVGMIMLFIFTVAIVVIGYDKIAQILEIAVVKEMIVLQIIGITLFCIIMTNTACVSISLEGKNLWILKSSPIKEMDIFKSKILLNIILTMPIAIICFMTLSFRLGFDIKSTTLVILTIILISIFSATLGIFINLLYPKMDFTSDVAVVKRGASVIISMISNVGFIALICGLGYILGISNINTFLLFGNIITVISIFTVYKLLKNKGTKMFRSL
ncbi:putative ABC transporter permease subunit [Terrisporobacter sp.]|uniref:putative ABC transporter permease subunit n=1 Tax=Terrisporobacter sp. TaxID=1965305 RepID=UPI00289AE867|nr:ABC transporter permease [Terrisporobacter sp.]